MSDKRFSNKRLIAGGLVAGGVMVGAAGLVIGAGIAKADGYTVEAHHGHTVSLVRADR